MISKRLFRRILPASQVAIGGLFGGWGLWQRNQILSHDSLFGTGWNSRARFHVWPWPFKFAVIENLPAFLAGALLSWLISVAKPDLSESVQLAPSLCFVLVQWYWIGLQLDRRWDAGQKAPWVYLAVFTAVCLTGAFVPLGYTGYLPYAGLIWFIAALAFRRLIKPLVLPSRSGL
jgi:hypothetical protein